MSDTLNISSLVRKWDGKKITQPGIVSGIPIEIYHQDICDGPSISSSGIRDIIQKSPLHYWDKSYLNPDRAEQEPKAHFSFGQALHHLCAGEDGFLQKFVVRPSEFTDYRTKAAKEWRDDVLNAGKSPLTLDDVYALKRCADQLMAHPTIQAGILHGLIEHSIFIKVRVPLSPATAEATGQTHIDVWVKCRPDALPIDALLVADLKSTKDASPIGVRRAITDYGYHVQMGMIADALAVITGREYETFALVFQESSRPHAVNISPLSAWTMQTGRMQFRKGLQTFADCLATGCWPTYEDDEVETGLMPYAADRLQKEIEAGALPPMAPLMLAIDALPAPATDEDEDAEGV